MAIPDEIWMFFLFALGASVGSFLNVVVYRVPRDMSLIKPGSHCCACEHPLAWYDNIPIIAWVLLRGRCRYCKAVFSVRYPLVELFTALLFVGLYWAYFVVGVRESMPPFEQGGWLIYVGHIALLCVLLSSSLIDGEHWIIPLSISYTAAGVGLVLSMIWPYWVSDGLRFVAVEKAIEWGAVGIVDKSGCSNELWRLIPYVSAKGSAAALGSAVGLVSSLLLLKVGLLKRSFAQWEQEMEESGEGELAKDVVCAGESGEVGIKVNVRREMMWEIGFLAPVVCGGLVFMWVLGGQGGAGDWWREIIFEQKWLAGLLGSVFGFMIGGAVVWGTRISGSFAFGREAMGMGDVHLMAAVGAVLGWVSPVIAFFVAPFFGLGWALTRLVLHRSREIPYGPFLSVGTLIVMILHDPIVEYFAGAFGG